MRSDVEQELLRVLDTLLDLAEEENGLTTIDDTMIVGESDVHDGAGNDLTSSDDGADLGGVHAEDGALGHVHDGCTHHGAENTTVSDSEGTTGKIFECDLTVTSLGSQFSETTLKVMEAEITDVPEDRHDESGWGGDGGADVNEVTVDHVAVIDDSVNNGLLLEGLDGGLHEGAHEAEFDAMLLDEGVLDFLAHVHVIAHIDLVEGGEKSVLVLCLLKTTGDGLTHPAHLHTGLHSLSTNGGGGLLGGRRGHG